MVKCCLLTPPSIVILLALTNMKILSMDPSKRDGGIPCEKILRHLIRMLLGILYLVS